MIKQFIEFSVGNVKRQPYFDMNTRVINIDPGRQSGKTVALIETVFERVKRGENTVVVQYSAILRDNFIRELKSRLRTHFTQAEITHIMRTHVRVMAGGIREFCKPSSPAYRGYSIKDALIVFEEIMTYNRAKLLHAFSAANSKEIKFDSACRSLTFTGEPIILILGHQ